ncbi:hypothetical protein BDN71DRAFT_499033 [Pleurotus eryngii]|uniref:lytic cellulose monooxygenase (C4-dehydrogenating) n=1 Tax=Pleurotus eryngii TaxID=5323 RepID=A0A9P6A9S7_PLEER|nr:hypothetical protein BDN71DRAFT_499033 [Pleurotus eryngii]
MYGYIRSSELALHVRVKRPFFIVPLPIRRPRVYDSSIFIGATALLQASLAAGHGFVHHIVANGQTYTGWQPFSDPYASPVLDRVIRKVQSDGPVPANTADIACGVGGQTGTKIVADADAGSNVQFQWDYWPGDHLGPVSTYMASCNGDCTNFDTSGARWFKIDAAGYDNGQWASAKLIADGSSWTSQIPNQLAAGQYLMRHEIIALHSAGSPQYYPACAQVNVNGSGQGKPSDSDLVSLPGLYDGVTFPNIYTDFGTFTIPGPPPVTFDGHEAAPSPTTSVKAPATSTAVGSSNSTSSGIGNSGSNPPSQQATPSAQCLLASHRMVRRTLPLRARRHGVRSQ